MKNGRGSKGHYQSQVIVAGIEKSITWHGRSQQVASWASGGGLASGGIEILVHIFFSSPVSQPLYVWFTFCFSPVLGIAMS